MVFRVKNAKMISIVKNVQLLLTNVQNVIQLQVILFSFQNNVWINVQMVLFFNNLK